ncbi:MAG: SIMPL domain-containing protein [Eubacteriales bacterium]|nr:SIMPL domain-containing protein [Eubacteriales bacterium]
MHQNTGAKKTILRASIAAGMVLLFAFSLAACKEEGDITPAPTARPEQPTVIVNNEAIPPDHTIVVSGYGVVTVEPDVATITIVTAGASASSEEAAALCEAMTQQVKDIAEAQSVLTRNISGITLSSTTRESDGVVTGYTARQTITIIENDIARVNTILSPIIDAKIIESYEVTYSLLDASTAYAGALAAAVADAKEKAEAIAAAGEVALDAMLLVTEAPVENQLVGVVFKSSSIAVEANLTVTFSIKTVQP